MLTPTQLKKILPKCSNQNDWMRPLNDAMRRFEINTPIRAAAFLAQLAVESSEFNVLEERLNYSPGRLTAVWPKRFPDPVKALPYSRNPEKLANAVYADRLGNGDEASGDGYRYRGRGLIQITGRDNYRKVGELLDIDLIHMPDTLLQPKYAALSAGAFWEMNDLNELDDIREISRKVNGGEHGLEQRVAYYERALEVLNELVGDGGSEAVAGDTRGAQIAASGKGGAKAQNWFE